MILVLACSARTAQAEYYIDAVDGNDANNGTTPSLAIKTIARLQQIFSATGGNVPSGETIHLFRGGRYEGQITVASNATGVTIQAYPLQGAGALPIVDGSTELTGWSHEGSGLWSAPWAGSAILMHLYVNDVAQTMARYPNTGWLRNAEYFTATPPRVKPAIDTPLPSGNLVGSYLVFRTSNFTYDTSRVIGLNGQGELELRTSLVFSETQARTKRWGFFLRGNLDLLDAVGEWCHDRANSKVYLKTGDAVNPPNGVRVSNHPFGVRLPGGGTANSGILIKAIDFRYQAEAGVVFAGNGLGSHQVSIEECAFRDVYIGIDDRSTGVPSPGGMVIHGNTFTNCFNSALILGKDGSSITGNMLVDIGLLPGFGKTRYGGYIGLRVGASGYLVEGNVINRTGYGGIEANGSGTIRRNHISRASAILTDGGGIQFDLSDGLVIEENTVLDLGDPVNLESAAPDYHAYGQLNYGIYFGNRSIQNATVQSNVVANCVKGIYVDHSLCSANAQVIGNTLFGNRTQLSITDLSNEIDYCGGTGGYPPGTGGPNYLPAYDDTYADNILYGLSSGQTCVEQSNRWAANLGALVDFGEFNGNYCFNPFTTVPNRIAVAYSRPEFASFQSPVTFALSNADWVAQYDATAGFSPLQLPDHAVSTVEQVMLTEPFNGGSVPAGWSCGLPGTRSIESNALRSIGSPWIEHLPGCGSDIAPVIGRYRLSFSASSAAPTVLSAGYWFNDQNLYLNQRFVEVGTSPGNYEMVVELDRDAPGDYRWFNITDGKFGAGVNATSSVLLDNVLVERVTLDPAFTAQIAANHRLFYNCPLPGTEADSRNVASTNGILTIPGSSGQCWSDVYGNFYAAGDQIPLDEWASIVLFRIDPTYDIDVAIYDVQGIETWTTDKKVRGSIVIESGETLTIDGATIAFADSRQGDQVLTNIVVQPGGMLNLINGAHLTTLQGCGNKSMWDGVKVLGNTDGTAFGDATIQDQSRISNALIGIFCGDGDLLNPGRTGPVLPGRVFLWGGIFENNRYDVVRHGRPDGSSGSGVNNQHMHVMGNTFITSAPLNYKGSSGFEDFDPVAHLMLSDHHYVFLADNTFANDIGAHTHSHRMGHGIDALNTNMRFWEPNAFRNLDHAIHSANTATSIPQFSSVTGCSFTDNICAVYFNGLTTFSVADNTIEMGRWQVDMESHPDEFSWNGRHRGIYTSSANGFSIQGNMLGLSAGAAAGALTEGIVVGFTQEADEIVYANTATGLERGFVGEGICADADAPWATGLQFQCNTNSGNATNFMGRKVATAPLQEQELHTIRARQGSDLLAVGNTLDQANSTQFYLNTENTAALVVSYFYEDAGAQVLNPALVTNAGLQEVQGVATSTGAINACDSPGPGVVGGPITLEELPSAVADNREAYRSLRYLHGQLLDGGDTEAIIANVDSICSIAELLEEYQEIGGEISPFLSIYALQSVIACESLSYEQRASVLIANPEPTQNGNLLGFMIGAGFPEYLIDAVKASWSTRTYRAELEMRMADRHTDMMQAAYHWINLLHQDSVPPQPEAIRHAWQQVDAPHARFAEAALFAGEGQYPQAKRVMELAAEEYIDQRLVMAEVVRMQDYLNVLAHADSLGRSPYELDSAEVDLLQLLVAERYDRVGNWASNLLCAIYGICRAPFTGGGDDAPKARRQPALPPSERIAVSHSLKVYPNPASSVVTFAYELPGNKGQAHMLVRDTNGRTIRRIAVNGEQGHVQWDARQVASGLYSVSLMQDVRVIESQHLIIQP